MRTQKTYWGQVVWLHACDELLPSQSINVGLFLIEPGKKQARHIHYGEEQYSYILEGRGKHMLDDRVCMLEPGSGIYLPPGVAHEMTNIGDGPLRGLICSSAVSFLPKFTMDLADFLQDEKPGADCADLRAAVEALKPKLRNAFIAPYVIFDAQWNLLLQNDRYPDFCVRTCNPCANHKGTPCLALPEANPGTGRKVTRVICPYGLVVYQQPLVHRETLLGWIRGGHSIQSRVEGSKIVTTHDTPKSSESVIQDLLRQLGRTLLVYCDFDYARREIIRKNNLFADVTMQKKELEQHLRLSEDKVTGLLIDRHFLFNTLNCMADMALQKKGESLYDAIISLADMLHYTAQKSTPFVKLRQEIAHIDNYLSLQTLRLNGKLTIHKNIPDDLLRCYVPMESMLPIIENAFVHGFKNYIGKKEIGIHIKRKRNTRLSILISNNGPGLEGADVKKINQHISSGNGHGLSLIFTKLSVLYGSDFSMRALAGPNRSMRVLMEIPVHFEDVSHD